jgi:hypothetical protein
MFLVMDVDKLAATKGFVASGTADLVVEKCLRGKYWILLHK